MTRIALGMLALWIAVAAVAATLPRAGTASNIVPPVKISDTTRPSTVGP